MSAWLNVEDDPVIPDTFDEAVRTRHMPQMGLADFLRETYSYTCTVCHTHHIIPDLAEYAIWLRANPL